MWTKTDNTHVYTTKDATFIVYKDKFLNKWNCDAKHAGKTWKSWAQSKTLKVLKAQIEECSRTMEAFSPKTTPLTLGDLEAATCDCPDCDKEETLFIHGKCHPSDPVTVSYTKGEEALRIFCHVCQELIVEVKVGE